MDAGWWLWIVIGGDEVLELEVRILKTTKLLWEKDGRSQSYLVRRPTH